MNKQLLNFLLLFFLLLSGAIHSQTTYYVGHWDPVSHPPVVGAPGWEIQDDNVTGTSASDPFASWSQFVNVINDSPTQNVTVNLSADAYIEAFDYDNDNTNENGILGHNLGVQLVIESSANGLSVIGSTDGCHTLLDNTANGNGNLFASVEGASDITFKGIYLLNGFAGAFDILNSTNLLFEDCVFDNNDLGSVPVFRITSANSTPMTLTFRNCSFINNNNNTAKFDITREATGLPITLDFEGCVWSCNSATSTAGTAIRVRNNASSSSPATDMTFTGCTFANNASGGSQGGAVYYENTTSTSVYTNCNFINNSVAGGNGGGAMFIGANETVTMDGCAFYGNVSTNLSADGGAIAVAPTSISSIATLNISNSTFDSNSSADDGGAINLRYVNATMTNVHFVNNTAGDGVVTLGNTNACLDITGYSCSGNSAPDGCIYNRAGSGCLVDNGGAGTGFIDLSGIAGDYACGAYCAAVIPGLCLAVAQGSALCGDPAGMGTICGSVFVDDLDGFKEIGTDDVGLEGVYILLFDIDGNIIGRTNSGPDGSYCFTDIPDGSYYVTFSPPDSDPSATVNYYDATYQNVTGNGANDSDIDASGLSSHIIVVDNSSGTTNDNDGTGGNLNTNNVDAGFTPDEVPLPLSLISFTGSLINCEAEISWSTAYEKDIQKIVLEKGRTGEKFEALETFNGKGSNDETLTIYNYTDKSLRNLSYYRLKIINTDGSFRFSNIITVKADCITGINVDHLYPNPTTDKITYEVSTEFKGNAVISILDMHGKEMLNMTTSFEIGTQVQALDLTKLSAGVYYIKVKQGETFSTPIKFVKL